MARNGPDEQVNDPTVIINTLGKIRILSDIIGALNGTSADQDFDLTRTGGTTGASAAVVPGTFVPVISAPSIPIQLEVGGTSTYTSEYALGEPLGKSIFNTIGDDGSQTPFAAGILDTYNFLAETFRVWWGELNAALLMQDFQGIHNTSSQAAGIITEGCTDGLSGDLTGAKIISDSTRVVDSSEFDYSVVTFTLLDGGAIASQTEPSWLGSGPSSYFESTYPQISQALDDITPIVTVSTESGESEDYISGYSATVSATPAPGGTGAPKRAALSMTVTVYNTSASSNMSVTATTTNSTSYGNLIFDPSTRFCTLESDATYTASSLITGGGYSDSGSDSDSATIPSTASGGTSSDSTSATVSFTLPPLSKATISVDSASRHSIPGIGVSQPFGSCSHTVTINGVTRTVATDMGFFGSACP